MGNIDIELWDEKHPLVQWALETRQALDKCAGPTSAAPKPQQ
jgi:hypothetical protein